MQLNHIQPPFATLHLADRRLCGAKALGQLNLRDTRLLAPFDEQIEKNPVLRAVN